jgi:hypothetical protein
MSICPKCRAKEVGATATGWVYECGTQRTIDPKTIQTEKCEIRAQGNYICKLVNVLHELLSHRHVDWKNPEFDAAVSRACDLIGNDTLR